MSPLCRPPRTGWWPVHAVVKPNDYASELGAQSAAVTEACKDLSTEYRTRVEENLQWVDEQITARVRSMAQAPNDPASAFAAEPSNPNAPFPHSTLSC